MALLVFVLLSAVGLATSSLAARERLALDPAQLKAALTSAQPGDIVTLKNGEWQDARITVSQGGAPGNPVEIRAETPGGVTLSGSSTLEINAPYVRVDGLLFLKGALKAGAVVQFNSHHGIVQNTAIVDYNPPAFETNYYWVFFRGDSNVVDRCYFKGKSNLEPLIGNALEDSRHNAVVRSYFKNIPYHQGNGREDIRVWGSGKMEQRDDDGAYFLIAANLFDHADGEGVEIISLKSNHNQVLRNTIVATRGCLNIRRGDFNTVAGNCILGQNVPGAEGLRVSGQHNLVQRNLVSHCGYGIRVACGEFTERALTSDYRPDIKEEKEANGKGKRRPVVIPTYPQVRYLTLAHNVLVENADLDLEFGSDYKKHWPESQQVLLPEECLIQDNRFVRPHGGVSIAGTTADPRPPLDHFTFQPNRWSENTLVGGTNSFAPAADGFALRELPLGWSEERETAAFKPLTPDEVGPAWVIARRKAGDLSLEEPIAIDDGAPPATHKKKKTDSR